MPVYREAQKLAKHGDQLLNKAAKELGTDLAGEADTAVPTPPPQPETVIKEGRVITTTHLSERQLQAFLSELLEQLSSYVAIISMFVIHI